VAAAAAVAAVDSDSLARRVMTICRLGRLIAARPGRARSEPARLYRDIKALDLIAQCSAT